MNALDLDEVTMRSQLRVKRDLLLKQFFGNPSMTWLAIEIRFIDDRIAELTEHVMTKRESVQSVRAAR